ncbi:acetyl-CoA hydrolase [Halobacteriales archaeon QS_1_68_17]|nr:MAG: acetyl-CoA hydrolase [Halobacteriales archaeon QS_1_68_17]
MTRQVDRVNGQVPRRSAREAAALIPPDATVAVSGFGGVGYPKAVPRALAAGDRDLSLSVVSGGGVGEEIDTRLVEAGAVERRYPFQADRTMREAVNSGRVAFHDVHVSRMGDETVLEQLFSIDVAVVEAVAVGRDWLIPSTSIGPTPAYVAAADELIVEVNRAQPLALGQMHDVYRRSPPPRRGSIPLSYPGERIGTERIEFDPGALAAVVESDSRDSPYEFREPTGKDEAIAANLAAFLADEVERNRFLRDRLCLQFGVGSLGNAVIRALRETAFPERDVVYFGEVIQDGLLDLLAEGVVDVASATSLALSDAGQDRLFDNVESYADRTVLRPVDVSNNPDLVSRFGVVGVNSAVDVDVYGHVNSTHIGGTRLVNGIGGSGDFARNAMISVVALPSVTSGGDVSRIVPFARHVDHTEHDVDILITEHGIADLRGRSPRERAAAVVEQCADPAFGPALESYLQRAGEGDGHVGHDFETAFDWQDG